MQTTPHQAAASFPIRLPFVPGRDPATTVMGLVDQLYYRDGRAFEERGNVSDAMWNTKASRVLGITRQGSCGNGVCEIGETCGWFVEKSVVPGAASDAEWAVHSRINSYNNFRHSVELATEAAELGRRLPGPIAQARATRCCPADCPIELKPCPAPPGSSEPCGGRGRCLPQAGQCDCFPGRGWTGAACGECAEGFYPWRGECQRKHPAPHPPPPRAPTIYIFPPPPAGEDGKVTWATLALALAGVAVAAVALCFAGSVVGAIARSVEGPKGGKPGTRERTRGGGGGGRTGFFAAFFRAGESSSSDEGAFGSPTAPERKRRGGARETVPAKPFRVPFALAAPRGFERDAFGFERDAFAPHRRLADFDFDRGGTLTLPAPRDDATDLRLAEASRRSYASGGPDARRPRPGRRGSRGGTRRFVDPAAPDPPALPSAGRAWTVPAPALTDPNAERLRLPDAVLTAAERLLRAESSPRSSLRRGSRGDDDAGADLLGLPSERGGAATKSGAPVPGPGGVDVARNVETRGLPPSRGVQLATRARAPAAVALAVALGDEAPNPGRWPRGGLLASGAAAAAGRRGAVRAGWERGGGAVGVLPRGHPAYEEEEMMEERMMEERMMEERMMEEELTRRFGEDAEAGYIYRRGGFGVENAAGHERYRYADEEGFDREEEAYERGERAGGYRY